MLPPDQEERGNRTPSNFPTPDIEPPPKDCVSAATYRQKSCKELLSVLSCQMFGNPQQSEPALLVSGLLRFQDEAVRAHEYRAAAAASYKQEVKCSEKGWESCWASGRSCQDLGGWSSLRVLELKPRTRSFELKPPRPGDGTPKNICT